MAFLQLKPKDCSPLGKFILEYMERTSTSMNQLADKAGLTRPGIRGICVIRSNPTESSLIRLAHAMGEPPAKLYELAYQNKIENPYNPDAIDFFINTVDIVFKTLHEAAKKLPENQRPSDNDLLENAIKVVKSSFATS
jgi:transcriptional regulator with XRE-family HTH domain